MKFPVPSVYRVPSEVTRRLALVIVSIKRIFCLARENGEISSGAGAINVPSTTCLRYTRRKNSRKATPSAELVHSTPSIPRTKFAVSLSGSHNIRTSRPRASNSNVLAGSCMRCPSAKFRRSVAFRYSCASSCESRRARIVTILLRRRPESHVERATFLNRSHSPANTTSIREESTSAFANKSSRASRNGNGLRFR